MSQEQMFTRPFECNVAKAASSSNSEDADGGLSGKMPSSMPVIKHGIEFQSFELCMVFTTLPVLFDHKICAGNQCGVLQNAQRSILSALFDSSAAVSFLKIFDAFSCYQFSVSSICR
jgi:hypothetical protein